MYIPGLGFGWTLASTAVVAKQFSKTDAGCDMLSRRSHHSPRIYISRTAADPHTIGMFVSRFDFVTKEGAESWISFGSGTSTADPRIPSFHQTVLYLCCCVRLFYTCVLRWALWPRDVYTHVESLRQKLTLSPYIFLCGIHMWSVIGLRCSIGIIFFWVGETKCKGKILPVPHTATRIRGLRATGGHFKRY